MFDGVDLDPVGQVNENYSWELKRDKFGIVVKRRKSNSILYDMKYNFLYTYGLVFFFRDFVFANIL